MKFTGVVIKADGTVPFDADVPEEAKAELLGHLVMNGHVVEKHPVTGVHRIKDWKPGTQVMKSPVKIEP